MTKSIDFPPVDWETLDFDARVQSSVEFLHSFRDYTDQQIPDRIALSPHRLLSRILAVNAVEEVFGSEVCDTAVRTEVAMQRVEVVS